MVSTDDSDDADDDVDDDKAAAVIDLLHSTPDT